MTEPNAPATGKLDDLPKGSWFNISKAKRDGRWMGRLRVAGHDFGVESKDLMQIVPMLLRRWEAHEYYRSGGRKGRPSPPPEGPA